MPYQWEKPFKDREELRPVIRSMGLQGHICLFLGFIFAILGIIAAAMGTAIGLEPIYWFLLAIVAILAGMPAWLTWMLTRHLLGIESKKEG
jgi:hypothetical protein